MVLIIRCTIKLGIFKFVTITPIIHSTLVILQGTLGTPDTIGGTATTFSYAIKPGGDGGMFQVNSGTGVIKSNANLNRHVRERMYGYVEKNYYCMYDLDECRINWLSPLSYKYKCRNYGIGGSSDR